MDNEFQPQIVAFVCRWCTYSGADLAGLSRLQYPPNTKVIMVPCSGRIDISFVLRAFMQGADGVLVSGCHPGDCHYSAGNYRARRRWTLLRTLLDVLGFDLNRLKMSWISASEGQKWAQVISDFTAEITALGPYRELHELCACQDSPLAPAQIGISAPACPEAQPAPASLVQTVRTAFSEGQVTKVLGWRSRPTLKRTFPDWFDSEAELAELSAPAPQANIVRLCDEPLLAQQKRLGVIARPHELDALRVLAQEKALIPENIAVFCLDAAGDYQRTALLSELSESSPEMPFELSTTAIHELDAFLEKTRAERFAFWKEASQRCLHCFACRQACPICHCRQCYVEKGQPQWFPNAATGMGNLSWLIVRAFHLAGRCVGCGACQSSCPADIPLGLLNTALTQSAWRDFGYRAGTSIEAPPLQADFRPQDPQDFIV